MSSDQTKQRDLAERARRQREQTNKMLAAYHVFADLWRVGVEKAAGLSEFGQFMQPATRELAEQVQRLETMLRADDAEW